MSVAAVEGLRHGPYWTAAGRSYENESVSRRRVYIAAALIAMNAATAPQTTGSAGSAALAVVLGALLYLTASRRSWFAWLLLETITATFGVVTIGAVVHGSAIAVAGALLLAITATVYPLEPGRTTRSARRSAHDGSVEGGHAAVSPGHD